jgi:hypothetical protein
MADVQATIIEVWDKPNIWKNPRGGEIAYIRSSVQLVGHEEPVYFDVGVRPKNVDVTITRLKRLVDLPATYEVEFKGEHKGVDQYKLLDYPGKWQSNLPLPEGYSTAPSGAKEQMVSAAEGGRVEKVVRADDDMRSRLLALIAACLLEDAGGISDALLERAAKILALAQEWFDQEAEKEGEGVVDEKAQSGGAPSPSSSPSAPTDEDWERAFEAFRVKSKAPILAAYRAHFSKPTDEITAAELAELADAAYGA